MSKQSWEIKSRYMKDLMGGYDDKMKANLYLSGKIGYLRKELYAEKSVLKKKELEKIIDTYEFVRKKVKR